MVDRRRKILFPGILWIRILLVQRAYNRATQVYRQIKRDRGTLGDRLGMIDSSTQTINGSVRDASVDWISDQLILSDFPFRDAKANLLAVHKKARAVLKRPRR
jgi:hypothetical protein